MDFSFEHEIAAPPDQVASTLLDRSFQDSLKDLAGLSDRSVLSQEIENGSVVRRTRCVLGVDLGAVRRFIGDGDPAWVEVAVWDAAGMEWRWHVEPEIAGELLAASGTISLRGDERKTVRRVDGIVKVRVPLYGGRVEGWIVDGLRRAYDEEADRIAAFLGSVDTA